jgi:hypothetical protein
VRLILVICFIACLQLAGAQTLVLNELCNLPSEVLETSGLELGPEGCFWTHNDSQNPAELYCVDTSGVIQRTVSVIGDINNDWEELAKDNDGNLYIGNFGNNSVDRENLRVVKIPSIDTCNTICYVSDTIHFNYHDQFAFPPNGSYSNFDMEAMFWFADSLHLFSKDRSNPSTGYTKHYRLPSDGGTYQALLMDSIYTGGGSFLQSITAADISEDGSKVVLLNADHIWLITDFTGTDFSNGIISQLALGSFTQKEAICFRNGFLYITDEQENVLGTGGKMYRVHPDVFVAVNENEMEPTVVYGNDQRLNRILLPESDFNWRLLNLDGRVLRSGKSRNELNRNELCVEIGVFILQLQTETEHKALMVRL